MGKSSEKISRQIAPASSEVAAGKASVNGGKPQRLRVDTGCTTALQWVTRKVQPESCTSKVAIGLAELSIPQSQTTVTLAGQTFRDVPTGLHRQAIFDGEQGLLGNGLLSRFETWTIDSRGSAPSSGNRFTRTCGNICDKSRVGSGTRRAESSTAKASRVPNAATNAVTMPVKKSTVTSGMCW